MERLVPALLSLLALRQLRRLTPPACLLQMLLRGSLSLLVLFRLAFRRLRLLALFSFSLAFRRLRLLVLFSLAFRRLRQRRVTAPFLTEV